MIKIDSGIEPVHTERCAEVKAEIRETLESMKAGQSFLIEGKIKKGTVKALAAVMEIKIRIAVDGDGKTRCWKV
jgi:hypothetical protein